MSRQTFKYYVLLIIGGILFYQLIDKPDVILSGATFCYQLMTPFFIGGFIAILLSPVVRCLCRVIKCSRGLSILFTYVISLIILIGVGGIIIPAIIQSILDVFLKLSTYLSDPQMLLNQLIEKMPYLESSLNEMSVYLYENLQLLMQSIMSVFNSLSTTVFTSIVGITSQLVNLIFGVTISIYLLIDEHRVIRAFRQFIHVYFTKQAEQINYFVTFSYQLFQDYIVGRLLDSFIIGLLAYIGFIILESPYVILFSFIIFITNIIPYFGPILGAIPPVLMTLLINPVQAIWVGVFILCLQQLDGNIIGPKIMGDKVGVSPLGVISSIIIGGALFGFIGFFLSVPVFAVLKEFYELTTTARLEKLEGQKHPSPIFVE